MGIILTPFAWLLMLFYDFSQNYGIALILFALVIKLVLFPFNLKGKKSMIQMNLLSSKMQQLQKQYGKDRERYNLEIQKLYEKEKVNPMSGCLWSFIPIIFLMVLYGIIREPLTYLMNVPADMIETVAEITGVANSGTYPQIAMLKAIADPAVLEQVKAALGDAGAGLFSMNVEFLGINLANIPQLNFWSAEGGLVWGNIGLFLLPLVSVGTSLLSMYVSMKTNQMNRGGEQNDQMAKTNRTMMIFMPIMSLWIGFTVPAGLSIYWIAQYIFSIFQELICGRLLKKDYERARAEARPASTTGQMELSAPTATIASASPAFKSMTARPMASPPDEQAVCTGKLGPWMPKWMAPWAAAMLPRALGTNRGETRSLPDSSTSCWVSAIWVTPARAVPRVTPTRRGSAAGSRPLMTRASWAAA